MTAVENLRLKRAAALRERAVGAGFKPAPTTAGFKPAHTAAQLSRNVGAGLKPAPTPNGPTPHLAPANLLPHGLAFERARAAAEALGLIGLPTAVLGEWGKLLATNQLLDALMPDPVRLEGDRVVLAEAAANAVL